MCGRVTTRTIGVDRNGFDTEYCGEIGRKLTWGIVVDRDREQEY